ncbi:phenylalanine--tRNA ligase subunit beta [Halorhodospira neutriphila]|uniref:Phenylalanine--tRNA ligase beta subunit n=1 Tax=Halorhodospira neutriphila TaxID=168379 RepID=A0ABS1E414_9GAMM|nr:phenylalanine--tRNA ligase subunit beta [Halorhodospira neutriphila]MBK1725842.1 phenylalanine--tRNA ligase subunit beta [Halorhodospira neutriphila]
MRVSEQWLREWVDPQLSTAELAEALTMAGLEVDAVEPAAPPFHGVVVGEIEACRPHPEADQLQVCRVRAGGEPLEVVCGAPNARPGLRAPLAGDGAELPGGQRVSATELRGVRSAGMLCSAAELGLDEDAAGLLELPGDLPLGADLRAALDLDDTVLEIELTPNRADCLGMVGVARDVAAITGAAFTPPQPPAVPPAGDETVPVELHAPTDGPRYCGRVIRGVDPQAPSPLWLRERLRRAGIRSVSALVDITNYVLLEHGQPLHAFDLARLAPPIAVRHAASGEALTLLGGERIELDSDVLVIADRSGPVALAGIMGGAETAVGEATTDVFLESAFFAPAAIAGRARRYGLHTDASHRYERGVDFEAARRASERATALILEICGGTPGPLAEAVEPSALPERPAVELRRRRLEGLLGWTPNGEQVAAMLERLGTRPEATAEGWRVQPPSWRFDLEREVDLVEEVARLYGYDALPERPLEAPLHVAAAPERQLGEDALRATLVERGYFEAITYAFVDPQLQRRLDPEAEALPLANPLSAELAEMRTSLWPGLLTALQHNQHRQHERVRLFEHGCVFRGSLDRLAQTPTLAGVCAGPLLPEQWDAPRRAVDFFDAKADVEALIERTGAGEAFRFRAAEHPALHPGQSARIERDGRPVGWLGTLHPEHAKALELDGAPVLFELEQAAVGAAALPAFTPISRYPSIRRDLAVLVDEAVAAGELLSAAREAAGATLADARLFDVYRGKGVPEGAKSVAMGLILQDYSRTLTDQDVDDVLKGVVACLEERFGASMRGE